MGLARVVVDHNDTGIFTCVRLDCDYGDFEFKRTDVVDT